jgi:Fe-S cluster biosynthesis and repair protein YggX
MTRMIQCLKLQKEAEGLTHQPYPGDLGKRVYESISQEAWQMWLGHQTMLINEYRLSMLDPKAREFLAKEMENYLFGDGSAKPAGFVPPPSKTS